MKRIPKHEPTSSYVHLVVIIAECMMRFGEDNHNVHDVHDGYEEDMAPSLDVNDTDKDKSNNSIVHKPFHKPLSDNIYTDVIESECNIFNETLSQNNSSDVPTNVITELKYDEHIEPSVIVKGASYFHLVVCIAECMMICGEDNHNVHDVHGGYE